MSNNIVCVQTDYSKFCARKLIQESDKLGRTLVIDSSNINYFNTSASVYRWSDIGLSKKRECHRLSLMLSELLLDEFEVIPRAINIASDLPSQSCVTISKKILIHAIYRLLKAAYFLEHYDDALLYVPKEDRLVTEIVSNKVFLRAIKHRFPGGIPCLQSISYWQFKNIPFFVMVLGKCLLDSASLVKRNEFITALVTWNTAVPPGAEGALNSSDFFISPEEKDDVLVISKSKFSEIQFNKYISNGYTSLFGIKFDYSLKNILTILHVTIKYFTIVRHLNNHLSHTFGGPEYARLVYSIIKWSIIVEHYNIKRLVTYNSWTLMDCIMVEFCRQKDINTTCYLHSFSESDVYEIGASEVSRSYMLYDQICIRRSSQEIMLRNSGSVSPNILEFRFEDAFQANTLKRSHSRKKIAVFLPSWGATEQSNNEETINQGLREILRLCKMTPEIEFSVKHKHQNVNVSKEISSTFKLLLECKNVNEVDSSISSVEIITSSDFVISLAVTSCSFEALCCDIPSVFLNVAKLPLTALMIVPDFVRTSADELYIDAQKFVIDYDRQARHDYVMKCRSAYLHGNENQPSLTQLLNRDLSL